MHDWSSFCAARLDEDLFSLRDAEARTIGKRLDSIFCRYSCLFFFFFLFFFNVLSRHFVQDFRQEIESKRNRISKTKDNPNKLLRNTSTHWLLKLLTLSRVPSVFGRNRTIRWINPLLIRREEGNGRFSHYLSSNLSDHTLLSTQDSTLATLVNDTITFKISGESSKQQSTWARMQIDPHASELEI